MDDQPLPAAASNIPEYTVTELSGAVKRTLEGSFSRIRVRGEITEFKKYGSGHMYFSLKDEGGKISGVIWKSAVSRLGLVPENGVEVIATGRVSSYGERSSYQLIVERMEYAGAGALLARIEMLRQKLAAEGLFAPERKQPLPLLPTLVGVVSSPQGAVIQDIKTTIARRFPRNVVLWPVPVQGTDAAAKIAAAIRGFDALPDHGPIRRPDVLIVARGGGSLEDLMAFNDEAVVRAAAACRIPLISAVGHETDTTLIDFASDRRAPTPTAAAELAVPMRAELVADLQHTAARLAGALTRQAQSLRLRLQRAGALLPDLPSLVGHARQRLDDRAGRLILALPNLVAARRAALVRAERHMPDPRAMVAARQGALRLVAASLPTALPRLMEQRRAALRLSAAGLDAGLRHAIQRRQTAAGRTLGRLTDAPLRAQLREARARLEGLAARLDSVSHEAVLARGFALVFDPQGRMLASASAIRPGAALRIRFQDGETRATAEGGSKPDKQGSLAL